MREQAEPTWQMNLEGCNERRRWAPARFHSHIIRVRRPQPPWTRTRAYSHTETHTHTQERKDEQGQSLCSSLMRGDRWEETFCTLPIKLRLLGWVCVCMFICMKTKSYMMDTVCSHMQTHAHNTLPVTFMYFLAGRCWGCRGCTQCTAGNGVLFSVFLFFFISFSRHHEWLTARHTTAWLWLFYLQTIWVCILISDWMEANQTNFNYLNLRKV